MNEPTAEHRVTFSGLSDGSVEWTCRCGAGRVAAHPAAAEAEADAHALPRDEHQTKVAALMEHHAEYRGVMLLEPGGGRAVYRALGPDGTVWCESSNPDQVARSVEGRERSHTLQAMRYYTCHTPWLDWLPGTTPPQAAQGPHLVARMPSMSGDSVDVLEKLTGRVVSCLLTNGVMLVDVTITGITWDGLSNSPVGPVTVPRLRYQLPDTEGESAVGIDAIGHLHVYGTADEPAPRWPAQFRIDFGTPGVEVTTG